MPNACEKYKDQETGEYTPAYEAFWEAVSDAGADNFDCEQIAQAMDRGLTPKEAAAEFIAEDDELLDDMLHGYGNDWEDRMNHDHSMDA